MQQNKYIFTLLAIFLSTNLLESAEMEGGLRLFSKVENELIADETANANDETLNFGATNKNIKEKSNSKVKNFSFESFLKKEKNTELNEIIPEKEKLTPINLENKELQSEINNSPVSQKIQILKSSKIKYPIGKGFSTTKKVENTTKVAATFGGGGSEVYIEKSSKIKYPTGSKLEKNELNDKISLNKAGNSKSNFIYYVKVYPNYENDDFKQLLSLNERISTKKDDNNYILIGPILKDNLGIITQIVKTKGYNLVEYVKNRI